MFCNGNVSLCSDKRNMAMLLSRRTVAFKLHRIWQASSVRLICKPFSFEVLDKEDDSAMLIIVSFS